MSDPAVPRAARPFTGRHMTAIMIGFFAVIIAVNVLMARLASSTFTGVVVENSYVAGQQFNRWLDEAKAEGNLGWHARAVRDVNGHVVVSLTGVPAQAKVAGDAWHPLGRAPDHRLTFRTLPGGRFVSDEALVPGRWRIRLEVVAQGRRWRTEEIVG